MKNQPEYQLQKQVVKSVPKDEIIGKLKEVIE